MQKKFRAFNFHTAFIMIYMHNTPACSHYFTVASNQSRFPLISVAVLLLLFYIYSPLGAVRLRLLT